MLKQARVSTSSRGPVLAWWCCLVVLAILAYYTLIGPNKCIKGTGESSLASLLTSNAPRELQGIVANISTRSSAALLDDAVAASYSHADIFQLMQWHQSLYCSSNIPLRQLPDTKIVEITPKWTMHVRFDRDYVSQNIQNNKNWDPKGVDEMKWALKQFESSKQHQAAGKIRAAAAAAAGRKLQQGQRQHAAQTPLVIDVGAGCGFLGLAAAAEGARVALFEAMPFNVKLLRQTLCANSWLADRVALYGIGLSDRSRKCHMISEDVNAGNGITVCEADVQNRIKAVNAAFNSGKTFLPQDDVGLRRLDTFISESVQAMKLDVEGHELAVVQGAEALLSGNNPSFAIVWYMQANFNRELMSEEDQWKYVQFLDQWYAVSEHSFQGPFYDSGSIKNRTQRFGNIHPDLFCVRKELVSTST